MATTIQISNDLLESLKKRKIGGKESYEEVIWDLVEDSMEISEETREEIEESRREIKAGKFRSLSQVKKDLGI